MQIKLGTKAETLLRLSNVISTASILDIEIVYLKNWKADKNAVIDNVKRKFGSVPLIVRSSSFAEDTFGQSNAGAFTSVLNVDIENFVEATETVFHSYNQKDTESHILVQPMLSNVIRSGVAFSHDPASGAAYRSINWADGADTEAVTSGKSDLKYCQISSSGKYVPCEHKSVFDLISELLEITDACAIDIEFAITKHDEETRLWLLQARPLVLLSPIEKATDHLKRVELLENDFLNSFSRHPFLVGDSTCFGVMPDWNPAEIIGIKPRPLALSLYREMVTDSIWAYQRNNYGYRNLRSFPLLRSFDGLPYIDIRVSLNSFIPADLSENVAEKLANFYLNRLQENPQFHDKIEFDVVCSCYTFDIEKRLEEFSANGFSTDILNEFSDSLRRLTNKILHPEQGLWRKDEAKIDKLSERRMKLLESNLVIEEKLYWLLEDTKRYGTLPFAGLARAGFIAIQLLRSLVNENIFTEQDYNSFMASISTVASKMSIDRYKLSKREFLNEYGHLRPGTYDILSPRYDQTPDDYFNWDTIPEPTLKHDFEISLPKLNEIKGLLEKHKIDVDVVQLFEFIESAIRLREYAKFEFTKSLSAFIEIFSKFGQQYGINREELSFANAGIFKEIRVATSKIDELLINSIARGKTEYSRTQLTSLPPLVMSSNDAWFIEWPQTQSNFVTNKKITADVINLSPNSQLAEKIVFIEGADPGYDWIFSQNISGLVTCWGGANSHMAIRAGELGLPAVIGVGEIKYKNWSNAKKLTIDCSNKTVFVVQK